MFFKIKSLFINVNDKNKKLNNKSLVKTNVRGQDKERVYTVS